MPVEPREDATLLGWLSPSKLDVEKWRWLGMKPQRGGWDQVCWVELQGKWYEAVTRG